MEMQVQWFGPFVLVPQTEFDGKWVFDQPECDAPGLYLWTIKHEGEYLVNYVGEAGPGKNGDRSLRVRLEENMWHSYMGGDKYVTIPQKFRRGQSGKNDRVKFATMREFLADYSWLSPMIHENFCSYRVFVAPAIEVADNAKLTDGKVRKYIEAGIIRNLKAPGDSISEFLVNKKITAPASPPLSVEFKMAHILHGLEGYVPC